MYFFFHAGMFPAAYTNIVTKTPKKTISEIGFPEWVQNTAAYKMLISSLPQLKTQSDETASSFHAHYFREIRLEQDGLNKKNIDPNANVYFDVLSSHNKNRIRLHWLIDHSMVGCIYITDIHVLGDTFEEIVDVYERCLKKEKVLCVIDHKKENRVSEYSMCDIGGTPYPKEIRRKVIDQIASLGADSSDQKSLLGNARGTNRIMLSQDFWNAYFLYEITMEIPEDIAVVLSGMSKNSFINKCLEMEQSYDQLMVRIGTDFYTYEELLQKTFALKGLIAEDFYKVPKRLGALPSSEQMTFRELRDLMTQKEALTQDVAFLQKELDSLCAENHLPKMLYLTYKRYCVKQDNSSKKTFSKFFHYDESKVEAYHNFVESIKKASEIMGKSDYSDMCRGVLRPMYCFDVL